MVKNKELQAPQIAPIRNDVPIPTNRAYGWQRKYPLRDLQVGQHIVVDQRGRQSCVSAFGRFRPKRFMSAKILEGPEKGLYRVWRVE